MAAINVQGLVAKSITLGISVTSNPLVAGPLLYILTRQYGQSGHLLKERLMEQIARSPIEIDLEKVVKVLKYMFALGLLTRANTYLNTISQNSWTLTAPTSDWVWDKEIAVITGGSAGIGEQTVLRLLQKGVRVAILDISPPTLPELMTSKSYDKYMRSFG